jgi:UDP-N-acetylmuramate dehydrogenase
MRKRAGAAVRSLVFSTFAIRMPWFSGFEAIVAQREPLAPHTWLGLGGPAEFFARPRNQDELAALVRRCHEQQLAMRLLGGGSNVLVPDEGVRGVVIQLSEPAFGEIRCQGETVRAGAGAKLSHVITESVAKGLAGLEALVGIPGTVGGALHGNAGSRGGDIGQWTAGATIMTQQGQIVERGRQDLVFAYRESSLDELVILSAEFRLEPEDPAELAKRMQKQWIVKKAEQPLVDQRAGCIFKSPRGLNATALIDEAGLGGTRVGAAAVSERNTNFIVADKGATSHDVRRLIDQIRTRVRERLSVPLELQIELW